LSEWIKNTKRTPTAILRGRRALLYQKFWKIALKEQTPGRGMGSVLISHSKSLSFPLRFSVFIIQYLFFSCQEKIGGLFSGWMIEYFTFSRFFPCIFSRSLL